MADELKGRKTLVLDLDETLIHSSFQEIQNVDFLVPVILLYNKEGGSKWEEFVCVCEETSWC